MSLVLSNIYATTDVPAATLPVDLATNTFRTMLRQVVPVNAGDMLDVGAFARVTNDCGYTIGVGWHLAAYDVDNPPATPAEWLKISPSLGDNVTKDRHHMPLHIGVAYTIPADWPVGHRITILLRADAHSTAAVPGDTLTVDQTYGYLSVRRYVPMEI